MAVRKDMKVDMGSEGSRTVKVDYPSNSNKQKAEKQHKVEKVITGGLVTRKKPLGKKFVETFIGEDVNTVSSYILHDVLIPAAKSTVVEIVQGGIEMLLFGEKKGTRTRRDGNRSYVNYTSYSSDSRRERERKEASSTSRARHNFDDIILKSRGEAEEVISCLVDLVIDYGEATVADLYDLVGITGNFTDNKYGWRDLSSASVSRVRDGYLLNLPRVKLLD